MTRATSIALQRQHQRGFVLVMTLAVLAIVAISVAYFAERVSNAVALAQQSRQNTHAMIDISATRAEILYRLGTTPLTPYGLGNSSGAIALDDRAYLGVGNTLLRIQDNRGLLNLNFAEEQPLLLMLGILGVPAEQRSRLLDTLRDYTDPDKLHRLNGAEEPEYLAQYLQPPTNAPLKTPWEARRIMGWRDTPVLWQNARLVQISTTSTSIGINPNTAPAEVLATLPGVNPETAQRIMAHRKLQPITDAGQLATITSLPAQQFADDIGVIPSNTLRITQSAPGLAWAIQYNITLLPNSSEVPWRTEYYSRVPVPPLPMNPQTDTLPPVPPLPPRSTELPLPPPL